MLARRAGRRLEVTLGGRSRTRVIVLLACVLALSSADTATVGASATQLRAALGISNTDVGLLVTVSSLTAAAASIPFGALADRVRRTRTLGIAIATWGVAMIWSASSPSFGRLLLARLGLGVVTAAAGPIVASLIGDYFPGAERGRIYGYVLSGELAGAGAGFAVTGDIAALSWQAAFVILALPAFVLAWYVLHMPEPRRGGTDPLPIDGAPPPAASPGVPPSGGPAAGGGSRHTGSDQDGPPEPRPHETDAQRVARMRGVLPDYDVLNGPDPGSLGIFRAIRYVLGIRTNMILILASSFGYFYLAGIQTFGVEFVKKQYGIDQAAANLLLLMLGAGAVCGVLVGGRLGDRLLARHHLTGRITVTVVAATATTLLFVPALASHSMVSALPYLVFAAFALAAQNPAIDAARLDIVPSYLWGRAEGVRTAARTVAQAVAPLLFGVFSDHVFGGGRHGLQWTFVVMLVPLGANAVYLWKAMRTYPRDVATAAALHQASMSGRHRRPRGTEPVTRPVRPPELP